MQISSNFLRDAKKLLSRIRYTRAGIPIMTHILTSLDSHGISLAVSDLDRWLETRNDVPPGPCNPEQFLIPSEAMAASAPAPLADHHNICHPVLSSAAQPLIPLSDEMALMLSAVLAIDESPPKPYLGRPR